MSITHKSVPPSTKEKPFYDSIASADDSDSDTLASSIDSLEHVLPKSGVRRHRRSKSRPRSIKSSSRRSGISTRGACLTWLRWLCIIGLQSMIIVLLALQSRSDGGETREVETGGDINGLFPPSQHKYVHLQSEQEYYMPNMTTSDDRMEIRRRWDMLMPRGSGSVSIPEYKQHLLLGDPIADDPLRSGPLFEASWTHALHCLYYSVDSYHQLVLSYNKHTNPSSGSSESGTIGKESDADKWSDPNPYHASHCFEYLRNSILCNLDMTLEGDYSAHREGGGQAHVCRDREQAIAWIEGRRVDDRRDIVGP